MGRFSTVALLLLAACGDNVDDDSLVGADGIDVDGVGIGDETTALPRLLPQVCGVESWTTNITSPMNVSVAMRGQTSITLATPQAGGSIAGIIGDPATHAVTTAKIDIDGAFSSVTTTLIGDRIASTAVAGAKILLHTLDDDLTNPLYIGEVAGRHLAEPALYPAQGDLVMPVGGDDGVWLHWYGSTFEPAGEKQLLATAPVQSFDATMFGNTMLATWSTTDSCYVVSANVFDHSGATTRLPSACGDPRLAVDNWGIGLAVFDSPEGASMMTLSPSQVGGNTRVLRSGTTSPRAIFDGTRFWISFLDERGDVVVGLLDDKQQLVSMGLYGPDVTSPGYELVFGDGSPWVVSLAGGVYTAYRLCAVPQ